MNISKKLLAFIAIDIACFLTILDSTIVNVSLPNMAKHFSTSTTGISWVSTAYLIAFSALLINFSKIADIFGRKKLFIIGLFVFGLASACCGFANTLPLLIFFRVLQGVGAAILTPLPIPLGVELYGKDALGKLSVVVGLTISVSAALGPVLGGILNEFFSYRAIFYVNIPFVILSLILGSLYVKESYDETISKKVDFIGCILISAAMGVLTFLLVKGNEYGWKSRKILVLILIVLACSVFFGIYESKIKEPMIDFKLFKIRSFTSSIILIAVFFYAYMPISYLINFYFEKTLGYSVLRAGLMMGIPSLTAFLATPLMPLFAKKLSARTISFLSILIALLGNMLLAFMTPKNHMLIICTAFVLMGIGVRITTILYQTAYEEISKDKNGIASGIQNSLRQLTACIAIALVSTLSAHYTTIAVDHTKTAMIKEVHQDSVLDSKIKTAFISAVKTSNSSSGDVKDTKATVHKLFLTQETAALSNLPAAKKAIVQKAFDSQEKELYKIIDNSQVVKTNESYKVYNKCFMITGLVSVLGFIAVPFNRKKREDTILLEQESYN